MTRGASPQTVLAVLRELVRSCRAEGVEALSVDELEAAIERVREMT